MYLLSYLGTDRNIKDAKEFIANKFTSVQKTIYSHFTQATGN